MKNRFFYWCLTLCFAVCAGGVNGQNTVSVTSGGFVSVNGHQPGTPVSTQNPSSEPINANLNFGNVTPNGANSRMIIVKMPIRISATVNYKIELQRLTANNTSVSLPDIGFGIGNIRKQMSGSPKLQSNATDIAVAGKFTANPTAASFINGIPRYNASLADIGDSPTIILSGVPTVNSGVLGEDENSILIDFTFVIVPQYFTPTDLSKLSLTITITPL